MSKSLVLFYVFLIFALSLRLYVFYSNVKTYENGQSISFETQILTEPKIYSSYQTIFVNIDPTNKVLIKAPILLELYYGDHIKVFGNLKIIVLNNSTRLYTMNYPKLEIKSSEKYNLLANIFSLRQKIITIFQDNLDPKSAGLLLGIVFGIKDNLPQNFTKEIQVTGVMHVIAASGMNVTMVSGFLFYLFALIFKRQIAIFLSIFGILFYTALAGFESSIMRAAIMGIIVFTSQILGRQQYGLNTLLITGFIMLFAWPQFLFNPGFQLSFAATFGLLYIPEIFNKVKNDLTEVFITTLSAQIATIPILLTNFGNYSIFSILVNGLVLWTIPILMILGSIGAFFGFIFMPVAKIFLFLCLPLLYYFEKVVSYFATFGTTFNFSKIPWQFTFSYYLFLLSFLALRREKGS